MNLTVGVDIGGSSIEAAVRDENGEIVDRYRARLTLDGGPQVAKAAVSAVRELDVDQFDAVGIGVPGQVNHDEGAVSLAVNLGIGSDPFDLAGPIEAELGCPVVIENDVRVAALGAWESFARAGRPVQSVAVVSIGTGISAGVVVDGVVLRGAHGLAGEIGHVVVYETGPVCGCGQRGCLEAVAAGPAIGRVWPRGDRDEAASALFAAVADDDPAAKTVARKITGHLTTALIWMAATHDPEVIVLAGGVPSVGDVFLTMMREQVSHRATTSELAARRLAPEQLVLANPNDPPGPRGAALLAARTILQERADLPAAPKANNQ